jgi:hypothetical protein
VSKVFEKGIESYEKILEGLERPDDERLGLKAVFNAMHLVKVRGSERGFVVEGKYVAEPGGKIGEVNARMEELWGGKLTFRLEAIDSPPKNEALAETQQSLANKKWLAELLSGAKTLE